MSRIKETPGPRQISFCPFCGTRLDEGARFCKNCGEAVVRDNEGPTRPAGNPTKRETVYEGYIHKCPNCGEILNSFVTNCPTCGYEIRDTVSTSSVRELAQKLEQIDARQMPTKQETDSFSKRLFGRDLRDTEDDEEKKKRFLEEKEQEKASLILNFSVPNAKEDILEFMLLASSNVDSKESFDKEVAKAWLSKLEQVYKRAEITMSSQPEFVQIKAIYEKTVQEVHMKNTWKNMVLVLPIVLFALIVLIFILKISSDLLPLIALPVFAIFVVLVAFVLDKK